MGELIQQVITILRSMWKHRWPGLIVAWVVGVVAAGVILRVPDKYEASARIFVDTQSILKPLMSGLAVQPNIDQQVMMLSRTLISRPNVEKLIRMADLDLGDQSRGQIDGMVDGLMKALEIKTTGRDNLYTLAYRDTDPEKAKKVVQSLVSIFVESSLGSSKKDSDTAKKFIDEQIATYEKKLLETEAKLKEFKLKNIAMNTEDGKTAIGRIGELTNQLSQARLELREAENAYMVLKRQVLGEGSANTEIAMPELDGRIAAQKANLDTLLQKYTDQHPDVLGARRVIRELEEQKRREVAELRKAAAANPGVLSSSAGSMDLRRSLVTSEAQVASLRARVGEYEARHTRLKESLKNEPELESELLQLNRDYNIHKKNYEDLVARRESASLSGELESAAGIADFRLIDPPTVSKKPVAPNRTLLFPMGLVGALAAGLGVCFLLSQLRPVFMDPRSLREATGLPLLGVVSLANEHAMRIRESSGFKRFILALSGLILFYGLGMAVLFLMSGKGG